MALFSRPFHVKRRRDGTFELTVDADLRGDLEHLFGQLDELLEQAPDDPAMRRLQPPAYLDDPDAEAAYRLLAGDELRTKRREAIDVVRATLDQERLSEDDLWAWMQSINALRLVLGTRLDVSEDGDLGAHLEPDDPDAPLVAAYELLTVLQFLVIQALGG